MPDYSWPDAEHRTLIGKRISRVDSPVKVSGRAKYTYDYHGENMLFGKIVRSPYAKAKIVSIDTTAAEKFPGVKAVEIIQKPGATVQWAGDEVVAVAAIDEPTAEDAARAIVVKYQPMTHMVSDAEPPAGAAEAAGPMSEDDIWDAIDNQMPDGAFIQYLQEHGITIHPSESLLHEFKGDGASDAVLDAIRKAPYHEPQPGGSGHSYYQKAAALTQGKPDEAFAEADVVSEGFYGLPSLRTVALNLTVRSRSGPTKIISSCTFQPRMFRGSLGKWPPLWAFPPRMSASIRIISAAASAANFLPTAGI